MFHHQRLWIYFCDLFWYSVFTCHFPSKLNQVYRNRYNLFHFGQKKKNVYVFWNKIPDLTEVTKKLTFSKTSLESLIALHQAAIHNRKRFSKLIKNLSDMPKSKTFVYITKHTAATLSISKIIHVSIVLNLTYRNVRE